MDEIPDNGAPAEPTPCPHSIERRTVPRGPRSEGAQADPGHALRFAGEPARTLPVRRLPWPMCLGDDYPNVMGGRRASPLRERGET